MIDKEFLKWIVNKTQKKLYIKIKEQFIYIIHMWSWKKRKVSHIYTYASKYTSKIK